MRRFLACIHDATPVYDRETRVMIGDLASLVGRRLSCAVVPNWNGEWPLTAYPDYCRLLLRHSDELLLHGYCHRRQRGWGPTTWLAEGSDEMNGLDPAGTRRTLERGQRVFTAAFGAPARGFLAPAWQPGRVGRILTPGNLELEHVLGFFSLESTDGRRLPLATSSWDCGRWGWLGYLGDGIGSLLQSQEGRVPVLAIHPRDLERGFWPRILGLAQALLESGYEPTTPSRLLGARAC